MGDEVRVIRYRRRILVAALLIAAAAGLVYWLRIQGEEPSPTPPAAREEEESPTGTEPESAGIAEIPTEPSTETAENLESEADMQAVEALQFGDFVPFIHVYPLIPEEVPQAPEAPLAARPAPVADKDLPAGRIQAMEPAAPPVSFKPESLQEPASEPESDSLPEAVLPEIVVVKPEKTPEPDSQPIPGAAPPAAAVLEPEVPEESVNPVEPVTPEAIVTGTMPEPAVTQAAVTEPQAVPEPPSAAEFTAPELTDSASLIIESPKNGGFYYSFVTVTGRASGVQTVNWTAEAVGARGSASPDGNGEFSFSVSTAKFRDNLTIALSGESVTGQHLETSISLVNDRKGPELIVEGVENGTFYRDFLTVKGIIGESSGALRGVGEVESLKWQLEGGGEPPRPVYFNTDGSYEFRIDMRSVSGSRTLVMTALDLNGNETRREFSLIDGRLSPGLVLSGPADGAVYGAALRLQGGVEDPYSGIGELGGIESLRYEIVGTEDRTRAGMTYGSIPITPDGSFDMTIFTDGLRGQQTVSLTVTGRNGRTRTETVTLVQGESSIPDFAVEPGDRRVTASWNAIPLADQYEITVTGKDRVTRRYPIPEGPAEISGLNNGDLYDVRVEALTPRGRFFSHAIPVIPLSEFTLRPVVKGEYRRIKVTWPVISGSDAYAVFRAESETGPFELIADNLTGQPYLDSRTQYGKTYWYSIAPASFRHIRSAVESGSTLASQENSLEQVAFLQGYETWNLQVVGDYAYGAAGDQGLVLFDVSESTSPAVKGRYSFPGALDVAVQGKYAYVASGTGGLKVLNIDDPTDPIMVGSRLAGNSRAVDLAGNYAYIADGERGLRIMDMSDPGAPVRLSSTEGFSGEDVIVRGNHAYLAAGNDGLAVIDIGIPSHPVVVRILNVGSVSSLAVRENLLAASGPTGGLILADISNPGNPVLLSQLAGINASQIDLAGDFVLALDEYALNVVDIRALEDPYLFDSFPMDSTMSLAVHGDDLLISSRTGLNVYRTFLSGQSYVTGGVELPGRPYGILRDGNKLYVSSHRGGVSIVDKTSFKTESVLKTDFAEQTAISGPWIFVADGISGLRVYNKDRITNGEDPVVVFENLGRVSDVVASGSAVFVASSELGLVKLNPGGNGAPEPAVAGTADLADCRAVAAAGQFVFATDGSDLVSFVDLPGEAPREIGRLALSGITSLDAEGTVAAAAGINGVTILSLNGQGVLTTASTIDSGSVSDVELEGRYLYVSAGNNGLAIYDITNPARPVLVSSCRDVFAVSSVTDGNLIYAADGEGVREIQVFIPYWLR